MISQIRLKKKYTDAQAASYVCGETIRHHKVLIYSGQAPSVSLSHLTT